MPESVSAVIVENVVSVSIADLLARFQGALRRRAAPGRPMGGRFCTVGYIQSLEVRRTINGQSKPDERPPAIGRCPACLIVLILRKVRVKRFRMVLTQHDVEIPRDQPEGWHFAWGEPGYPPPFA